MSDIPSDVHREVLRRLPAESLIRFRAVCKAWRRIIDDPSFIRTHTNNQQSDSTLVIRDSRGGKLYSLCLDSLNYTDGPQTIDVSPIKQLICSGVPRLYKLQVASCNGLILISSPEIDKNWVIWNPLNRDFHKLAQLDSDLLTSEFSDAYDWLMSRGFGYDYVTDDYKVVRLDRLLRGRKIVYRTLVYSLKLGFWRIIKDCPCYITFMGLGVSLNGALHWGSWEGIVVLDLGTEDYRQLSWPPIPTKRGDELDERLDALGGCLVLSYYKKKMKSFEGWVMRDYGVEKSWMKLFSIQDIVSGFRPVAYLKSKRQIFLQRYNDKGLFWIDLENNSVRMVTIHGLSNFSSYQFCPGSLFRLNDSGSASAAAKRTAGVKRKRAHTRLKLCVRLTNNFGEPIQRGLL